MAKAIILANFDKPETLGAIEVVRSIFHRCCVEDSGCYSVLDSRIVVAVDEFEPDYAIVLGGDGTILSVARSMKENQTKIIGINFGKLGFLADFSLEDLDTEFLSIIESSHHFVCERLMLTACIASTQYGHQRCALNDVVINAGAPHRAIYLELKINDRVLNTIGGDGIIVSTPTGSTGYNRSAGGPLVLPGIDAIIVNPICTTAADGRAIIVDSDSEIILTAVSVNEGTIISIDGQETIPFKEGESLVINKAPYKAQIVRNPKEPIWSPIVKKFKWGTAPAYRGVTADGS